MSSGASGGSSGEDDSARLGLDESVRLASELAGRFGGRVSLRWGILGRLLWVDGVGLVPVTRPAPTIPPVDRRLSEGGMAGEGE